MNLASRISNTSAPNASAFHQAIIFAASSTPNSLRLAKRLCWFFVQAVILSNGVAQTINGIDKPSSIIATVSDKDALAYNNATKLVRGPDGKVHLVFHDQGEIFYAFSTDHGSSWSMPLNISYSGGRSVFPAIAVDSTRIHFAWQDDTGLDDINVADGKQRIWFKSFRDTSANALRFPYPIGEAVGETFTPCLVVKDGRTLVAVWAADMGLTIGWEINISTGSLIGNGLLDLYDWTYPAIPGEALGLGSSFLPMIDLRSETAYVTWLELIPFGQYLAYFKHNQGLGWSPAQWLYGVVTTAHEDGIPSVRISTDGRAFLGFPVYSFDANVPLYDAFVAAHEEGDQLDPQDGVNISNTPEPEYGIYLATSFDKEIVAVWESTENNLGRVYFSRSELENYDKNWSKPLLVSEESISAHSSQVVAVALDTLLFVWLRGDNAPFEIVTKTVPLQPTSVNSRDATAVPPMDIAIYPNPSNSKTNLEFSIPHSDLLSIDVYNLQGQLIKTIVHKRTFAGSFQYRWDGMDSKGVQVSSGIYLVVVQLGKVRQVRRLVIVR